MKKRIFEDKIEKNLNSIIKDMEGRLGRKLTDEEVFNVIKSINHMAIHYNGGDVGGY